MYLGYLSYAIPFYNYCRCINQLSGYNGYDLLRMKAKDINSLIEHDEAQRLTGHLTLQKNMSGVSYTIFHFFCNFCIFVFNITLEWCQGYGVSVISWQSALLVEEIKVPGGNQSARRKPPICSKSLINLFTQCCIECTSI